MMSTLFLTLLALCAFAGNSVLCRLALGEQAIDAVSFTSLRLLSALVVLLVLYYLIPPLATDKQSVKLANKSKWKNMTSALNIFKQDNRQGYLASLMLFIYALSFSFAYISLGTATGALILFASVQVTMIVANLLTGKRLHWLEFLGFCIALVGLTYLMLPDMSRPSFFGGGLMSIAGCAWGVYSLLGRQAKQPLQETYFNFLRCLPPVLVLMVMNLPEMNLTTYGVYLALLSGGLMSGLGYAIWYKALKGLSITQAAIVQLSVPIIAALGGIVFAGELLDWHFVLSSLFILGGILLILLKPFFTRQ